MPKPSVGQTNWGQSLNDYLGTLQERANLPVNVKNLGATGDGFTDDTNAIQAAIDAAGDYGTVLLPPGTFVITRALSVAYNYLTITGSGYRSSRLYLASGSNSAMIATADDGVQRYGLHLAEFGLAGNAANQTGTSPAIDLRAMSESRLSGLYVIGPRGDGIRAGQMTAGMYCTVPIISECVLRGDTANTQGNGIALNTGSSDAQVYNCDIGFFTLGAGVLLSGHDGASVHHTNSWQNKFGFQNYQANRTRYTGCLSDYAKQHGFVTQSSSDLQFDNCQARESSIATASTYDGFRIDTAFDVSLSNCRAMGSQARVGVALFQSVTRARVLGGSLYGNAVSANVVGSGCSDWKFLAVAGMTDAAG